MNSFPSEEFLSEKLQRMAAQAGAVAIGFACAEDIDHAESARFNEWIARGKHAGMDYMPRHAPLRVNPKNILPQAQSVISLAFSYHQPRLRHPSLPLISPYAYGRDYHNELRSRLRPMVRALENDGFHARICIDSAPLPERYWALRAGIGRLCDNGCVAVDGHGAEIFLAEILTDAILPYNTPAIDECLHCGACRNACPTGALQPDRTIDCRKCINYLSIEHQGSFSEEERRLVEHALKKHKSGWMAGCDICQRACPLNANAAATSIPAFLPRPGIMTLTPGVIASMESDALESLIAGSPLRRAFRTSFSATFPIHATTKPSLQEG